MKPSFYFYANPYQSRSISSARALQTEMEKRGAAVYTEAWLARQGLGREAPLGRMPEGTRALVAFGGDGTLLRCAPDAARQRIPLLGVHTGTVGFLMPGDADQPKELADLLLQAEYPAAEYPLLSVRYGEKRFLCLNDVSLTRGEHPGVMETLVEADGEIIFRAHGDGAVVSTPLGCTAYGLAAGGPVVRPDVPCLMITPLCARELTLRPVILPLSARVTLRAHGSARRRLQLAIDGQTLLPVTEESWAEIQKAPETIRLIQPEPARFFDTLRQKQIIWNQP